MSFYTIQENWNGYENFFENGVFDENGIKEAKEILVSHLKDKIEEELSSMRKDIMSYEQERDLLWDALYFYEQNGYKIYHKDYINSKIGELTDKIAKKQEAFDNYKAMLKSGTEDEIFAWKGYKIVEVPIFDHCNEEILREFI